MKGKRGQIFLVGAIIFVFALYTVVIPYNTVKTYPALDDYKDLSDNYQAEFPRVFNWALYRGENVGEALGEFNSAFTDQARNVDPNFGVFYAFRDSNGNLRIVNNLNQKILLIDYIGEGGREYEIILTSSNIRSEAEICIDGLSCTGVSTDLDNYGRTYNEAEIENTANINRLIIRDPVSDEAIPIDITQFTSMSYTSSENRVEHLRTVANVEVSLANY